MPVIFNSVLFCYYSHHFSAEIMLKNIHRNILETVYPLDSTYYCTVAMKFQCNSAMMSLVVPQMNNSGVRRLALPQKMRAELV